MGILWIFLKGSFNVYLTTLRNQWYGQHAIMTIYGKKKRTLWIFFAESVLYDAIYDFHEGVNNLRGTTEEYKSV